MIKSDCVYFRTTQIVPKNCSTTENKHQKAIHIATIIKFIRFTRYYTLIIII